MTDDREMLMDMLNNQRRHLVETMANMPEEFMLASTLPSRWSPAGLIHHLTHDVERFWFRKVMLNDPGWQGMPTGIEAWELPPGQSGSELQATYQTEIAAINDLIATIDLDASPRWWDESLFGHGAPANLREIILHVIVETATHAGHMDIVRELHDGRQNLVLTDETRPGRTIAE